MVVVTEVRTFEVTVFFLPKVDLKEFPYSDSGISDRKCDNWVVCLPFPPQLSLWARPQHRNSGLDVIMLPHLLPIEIRLSTWHPATGCVYL